MAYRVSEFGMELMEDVKRFCQMEIQKQAIGWDKGMPGAEEARCSMAEMGFHMMTLSEPYGGLELNGVDTAALLEEIARADAGMAVSLAGNNLAVRAVLAGGTEAQKEKMGVLLGEGGMGAFCLTESQAGSDVSGLKTKAIPTEDGGYLLTGTKQFITNGSVAAFYVVAAIIDGDEKPSLFFIEAGTSGLEAHKGEEKLGIHSCDTCEVDLNQCKVDGEALLGGTASRGAGMKSILAALNEGRLLMSAMATGVAQRAMEEAIAYSKERRQFGKPIAEHQAIRFRIADMKIKIEAARQLITYGLEKMNEGKDFAEEAAMAKAFAADTVIQVTSSAMDVFGGYGFSREYPMEKLLRDARVFQIIEGTAEMQRSLIADKILGKERR